jgi:carboxyl-terminal processing protease
MKFFEVGKHHLVVLAMAVILAATPGGPVLAQQQAAGVEPGQPAQLTLDDMRTFTDVFNQIRRNYVEEVDDLTLLNAAINGMLSAIDPHSSYMQADEFQDLNETASGRYSGIGVDVDTRDGRLLVRHVISPSPADSAGIEPGDRILSIDQQAVEDGPLQQAVDQLAGEPGTTVDLSIQRNGEKPRELTLTREYIVVPTIDFQLFDKHYGYFGISYFHRDSATHLREALESAAKDGVSLHGLILDLRDNPGGVLQPAVTIADGFLDEGVIVTTRSRNEVMQMEFTASPGQWLNDIPLVVLVDRGSASASEVLAGALQDHERALIVGERTFGKGSVQSVLPLRNGSGIKLTTARYYTPSGRSIQAEGINPDVTAAYMEFVEVDDHRVREADLEGHLAAEGEDFMDGESVSADDDFPLYQALNLLKSASILSQEKSLR